MTKKLISFIIAAAFLLQLTPVFAFTDTDDTEYETAVNVLEELSIIDGYEDKTFRPSGSITRAEFAAMVVRMLDTSIYHIPEDVIFTDVGKKHWAFEYVNAGYAIGYFSGYGDGIFCPDEKITFSEVVKTMVTILGYKPIAEAKGGYPSGYVTIANQKDLLDGLTLESGAYVTRGDVALLLYNCLNKPKLEQTAFGSDRTEYTEDETHTILTDELKVSRYEGIVTATRHSGLYGMAELGKDEILIDGTKLAVGKSDISAYLGYNLVVYAKDDTKTKDETVLFYEIKDDNTVTTVVADNIDSSTNLSLFSYWDDDEIEEVRLSDDVQIIVNGKHEPFAVSADIKPLSGAVTLLNNDDNKDVDVVIVKKYSHYVVDKLDSTDLVIYDKYGKEPIELSPNGKDVDYRILRSGSDAKFKNISVGAVLSVLKSIDGEYMEINIVVSPVRGTVNGIDSDGSYLIGEDGKAYKRSADLPESEKIEMGFSGNFYLDIDGKIIKVEAGAFDDGNYCYLMDAAITGGLASKLKLKIINPKGTIEALETIEKVSYNGNKVSQEDLLALLGGVGTIVRQPLKYAQNEAGAIVSLETPSKDYDTASRKYRQSTKMFGYSGTDGFLISSEDTVMFQVPTSGGADESYKVIKYDDLANYDVDYSVTGYDLDGLTVACAVVDVPEEVTEVKISGTSCILMSVRHVIDKDGEFAYKLQYMRNGKKQENILSDKAILLHYDISKATTDAGYTTPITLTDLKPGDVFYLELDGNDKVNSVARVLSVGGKTLSSVQQFSESRGWSAEKVFGTVKKRVDSGMLVYVDGKGDYLYDITKPTGGIYLYDSRTETVTVASANDIIDIEASPGDPAYAYVRCHTGIVYDVVIYYQSK